MTSTGLRLVSLVEALATHCNWRRRSRKRRNTRRKTVAMPSRCNSPPEVFVVEQATSVQTHPSGWIRFIWKVKHVRVLNIWRYCKIVAAVRLKWWTNAVNRWIKCGDWPLNYGNGVCQESTCVSAYVHQVIEIILSCVNAGYVSECFSVVPKWNVLKSI